MFNLFNKLSSPFNWIAKKAAEAAAAKVMGGHNIFTGPIKDNKGNVVIKAGDALDDGRLWSDVFFYAEGIQGEMPG